MAAVVVADTDATNLAGNQTLSQETQAQCDRDPFRDSPSQVRFFSRLAFRIYAPGSGSLAPTCLINASSVS